jgi:hypothetical protein
MSLDTLHATGTFMSSPPGAAALFPRQIIDPDEVRRALAILTGHGEAVELRAITKGKAGANPSRSRVLPAADVCGLVAAAQELAAFQHIYLCLNPLPLGHAQRKAGKDEEVLRRWWLLLDIDPDRPDAPNADATDEEHRAAGELALAVDAGLTALAWPAPLHIDSGNGRYLLYRTDLPNTPLVRDVVKLLLWRLKERFDTLAAQIDPATFNASRIAKLPGTWSRKGPGTPERPHRMARCCRAPAKFEVVTWELLLATVGVSAAGDVEAQIQAALREVESRRRGDKSAQPSAHASMRDAVVEDCAPGQWRFGDPLIATSGPDALERAGAYLAKVDPGVEGCRGSRPTMWAARVVVYGYNLGQEVGFQLLWGKYSVNPCAA